MKLPRNAHLHRPRLQKRVIPADKQRATALPAEPVAACESLHHPRLRVEPRVISGAVTCLPRERGDESQSRSLQVEDSREVGRGDGEKVDVAPGCALSQGEGEKRAVLRTIELCDDGGVGGDGEELLGERGQLQTAGVVQREETAGAEEPHEQHGGGVQRERLRGLTTLQREELDGARAEACGEELLAQVCGERQHAACGVRVLVVAEGEGDADGSRVAENGRRVHADAEERGRNAQRVRKALARALVALQVVLQEETTLLVDLQRHVETVFFRGRSAGANQLRR